MQYPYIFKFNGDQVVKNVNQGILFDLSQNSHFQNHEECMADSAEKWYLDPGRKKGLKDQADWIFSIAYCALNVGEFYSLPCLKLAPSYHAFL